MEEETNCPNSNHRRDNQMDASTSAKEVAACVRDKPITSRKMYHKRLTPTGSDVISR